MFFDSNSDPKRENCYFLSSSKIILYWNDYKHRVKTIFWIKLLSSVFYSEIVKFLCKGVFILPPRKSFKLYASSSRKAEKVKGSFLHVELNFEIMVSIWSMLPYYSYELVFFIIGKSETRFSNTYKAMTSAYTNLVKSKNLSEGADGAVRNQIQICIFAFYLLYNGYL